MDGGAWRATVHGIAKSRIRLSDFTFTFLFFPLFKEAWFMGSPRNHFSKNIFHYEMHFTLTLGIVLSPIFLNLVKVLDLSFLMLCT